MIRVLYLISGLGIGGAEIQLWQTISRLERSRIEPHICTLASHGPLEEMFNELEVPVHYLGRSSRYDIRQLWRLIKVIRTVRPDILHSHMFFSNLLARLSLPFTNRPILISQDHGLSPWKDGRWAMLDRLTSPLVWRHIMVSECSRQLRLQRERFRPEKTCVIYNAVDVAAFSPELFPAISWDKKPVIGCVASLKEVKSIDTLIHAIKLLIEQGKSVELRLVGDGQERAALASLVNQLNIAEFVSFLGSRHDIAKQLSQMHIFVLPSVREDLPVSLLEAMAMGRACIASAVGGIPEIIESGQNGLLVAPNRPLDLAQQLSFLVDRPEKMQSLGYQARQTVLSRFDLDLQVVQIMDLYQDAKRRLGG